MMSGQIWADSRPGQGSTFAFTAWIDLGSSENWRWESLPARLVGMRTLVVDDNPVALAVFRGVCKP